MGKRKKHMTPVERAAARRTSGVAEEQSEAPGREVCAATGWLATSRVRARRLPAASLPPLRWCSSSFPLRCEATLAWEA